MADGLCTRILEKQNWLQMSQVLFRCLRVNPQVVLLFKDSKSGTAEPKGTSNHFHKARASEKITAVMLIAPKDFPFNNFGPAIRRVFFFIRRAIDCLRGL
jgi:hypothetical protein